MPLKKVKGKVQDAADRLVKTGTSLKADAMETADDTMNDAKSAVNKMK